VKGNYLDKNKLLEIKDLKTYFFTEDGISKAVDGVDLEIYSQETLGIVGESGCGKSITARSVMRLIPEPPGRIVNGQIFFKGRDLLKLKETEMRDVRGNCISMIFQEPMISLNPVFTIGNQISEPLITHKKISKKKALLESIEMLKKVGIPTPEKRVNEYPHELSGGMRQRAMIAMALSCNPELLIADEPTTALDVTIQAQVLDLMKDLKEKYSMSIIIITHDLGVIAEMCDRVAVMYAGNIIEYTDVTTLFSNPKHPYTLGLLKSLPRTDKEVKRLQTIPGNVPSSYNFPKGCKFHNRCPLRDERCLKEEPVIKEIEKNHKVRCWNYKKINKSKITA
jgi:peptide/nickel transport system ATP-binding protein/oligopeptide transport system ATP-binding protein